MIISSYLSCYTTESIYLFSYISNSSVSHILYNKHVMYFWCTWSTVDFSCGISNVFQEVFMYNYFIKVANIFQIQICCWSWINVGTSSYISMVNWRDLLLWQKNDFWINYYLTWPLQVQGEELVTFLYSRLLGISWSRRWE